MKVYNQSKTEILEDYDLEKGRIVDDLIEIPEVAEIQEQWHYEVVAEYPNGGKDVVKVIDVEGRKYQPAHQENIYVYIPYTPEELEQIEISLEIFEKDIYIQK